MPAMPDTSLPVMMSRMSLTDNKQYPPLGKSTTGREVLQLVNNRYKIMDKLGEGSFGEVRLALDTTTGLSCAIKFEHKSDVKRHLHTEYEVYTALAEAKNKDVSVDGFVNMHWYGRHGDYRCLVMDQCGSSLKDLYERCHNRFPVQTVALIAIQLLSRLEVLHFAGWVHQDIKPENVVMGSGDNKNVLYLLDYGTSAQYLDPVTKLHQAKGPSTKIVGTARYSSLNNHYGYLQSRRDDLESLGYTLLFWMLGRLPWQGINEKDFRVKWNKIRQIKKRITPEELTKGLPMQFRVYMKYVFGLRYAQAPSYSYLRGLFRQLIDTTNQENVKFCWETQGNQVILPK